MTTKHWQETYQALEVKYQENREANSQLIAQVNEKELELDKSLEDKVQSALDKQNEAYKAKVKSLQEKIVALETKNETLNSQLDSEKQSLGHLQKKNQQLEQTKSIQASVFERSREVFQKELTIKQELEKLESEKESLNTKISKLKKACDLYLAGTSWDATSDSCDKQDQATSRLSQVNQMISVHKMDLQDIKIMTEKLGLE
ncbi:MULTISPECIES: chromosome partitioning protein ParA [unclassified Vibrio]|uniref:Chromosome partitioning protein ParA n=1 Tax=Vibrio sp. HB236076 TaxID=3232307 RepID=A0AB39HDA0_9VIBR|nr:chromosome partitioning protein ParA [Vibrio sp. HB161653]MDP5254953.1 chromosome partitioning protein ParA [Vibrio sp. HB161653]